MYKIFVVDDEPLECKAIHHIIEKYELPVKWVGESGNGIEAVERATKLKPDIIMMDIKMPGMDGLEATAEIIKNNPHVMVIILSAYDEFDYARKAVKLGALDYVLKPARSEEIVKVINKALEKLEAERQLKLEYEQIKERMQKAKPYIKMSFVLNLISGCVTLEDINDQAAFLDIDFLPQQVMIIGIDEFTKYDEENNKMKLTVVRQNILDNINQYISNIPSGLISPVGMNKIVLLLSFDETKEDRNNKSSILKLAKNMLVNIKKQFSCTVTIGIGRSYKDITDIRESYLQARKAFKMGSLILGGDQVIYIDDLQDHNDKCYPIYKEKVLHNHIINGEWQLAKEDLEELLKEILESQESIVFKRTRINEIVVVLSRSAIEEGADQENILRLNADFYTKLVISDCLEDITDYIIQLVTQYEKLIAESHKTYSAKIILEAHKYIENNYSSNINMKDVAESINLSSHYFSRLFKKESGYTFLEYLTKTRLNKAKQLLHDPSLTITEIAQRIGYDDACYFSRLFKKHETISPKEYRSKLV